MEAADVISASEQLGLGLVRFLVRKRQHHVRAKATALAGLEARMRSGIGVTLAMEP